MKKLKPQDMLKDSSVLAEKNLSDYYSKMKQNRWWQKGYKAGKKQLSRDENPYTLTPDIIALLRKRTYWEMGYEDGWYRSPLRKRFIDKRKKDESARKEEIKQDKLKRKAEKEERKKHKKDKHRKHKRHD